MAQWRLSDCMICRGSDPSYSISLRGLYFASGYVYLTWWVHSSLEINGVYWNFMAQRALIHVNEVSYRHTLWSHHCICGERLCVCAGVIWWSCNLSATGSAPAVTFCAATVRMFTCFTQMFVCTIWPLVPRGKSTAFILSTYFCLAVGIACNLSGDPQ